MKRTAFFPLALMLALTVSCQKTPTDDTADAPVAPTDTTRLVPPRYLTLAALTQWFEDEYSINFILQVKDDGYMHVSEGVPLPYTPATDTSRIKRLLYYIGDNELSIFPARTVAKYMPPTIYLVDSLKETYSLLDELSTPGKTDRRSWRYPIAGQSTGDYLVIGNAGTRFDERNEGLREELLSLFIDRMLYNNSLPAIDAFRKFSEDATLASGIVWESSSGGYTFLYPDNYPYWDGQASTTSTTTRSSGDSWAASAKTHTPWNGRSVLKVGRAGCNGYEARNLMGITYAVYLFVKPTLRQDFGDFASFIISTSAAERETFYAQVEANKTCNTRRLTEDERSGAKPIPDTYFQLPPDTLWYDSRFPYGGTHAANAMRLKDAYVKAYLNDNLQVNAKEN
jgi:hypothetical protein